MMVITNRFHAPIQLVNLIPSFELGSSYFRSCSGPLGSFDSGNFSNRSGHNKSRCIPTFPLFLVENFGFWNMNSKFGSKLLGEILVTFETEIWQHCEYIYFAIWHIIQQIYVLFLARRVAQYKFHGGPNIFFANPRAKTDMFFLTRL